MFTYLKRRLLFADERRILTGLFCVTVSLSASMPAFAAPVELVAGDVRAQTMAISQDSRFFVFRPYDLMAPVNDVGLLATVQDARTGWPVDLGRDLYHVHETEFSYPEVRNHRGNTYFYFNG